jgi:hypothetical protein
MNYLHFEIATIYLEIFKIRENDDLKFCIKFPLLKIHGVVLDMLKFIRKFNSEYKIIIYAILYYQ